jgi:hypothetical protein
MKITLLLADSAQVVNGKLYVLGGGWTDTVLTPDGQTVPHALATVVEVPWDQTNVMHHLSLRLVDADGHRVEPVEGQPIQIDTDAEVGRPPGAQPGVPLPVQLALNLGPLPLAPGRYAWTVTVDDNPEFTADVGFTVRRPGGPMRLAS